EIEFKKPEFDASKFMSNMVDKQLPEKSGAGKEGQGAFKEDGSVPKPADVPPPKKGKGKDAAAEGKGGKKPDTGKGVPPKKPEPPNAETQKKAGEILKAAAGPLKNIQGPLTRSDLNTKLAAVKQQVKDVDFDLQLKGKQWEVRPKALGIPGGAKSTLKIDAIVKPEDEKAGKGNDTIAAAFGELDTEGKQKIADGEVTKADADQIKADVNRDHPSVIEITSVKEAGENWEFEYLQKKSRVIPRLPRSNGHWEIPGSEGNCNWVSSHPDIVAYNNGKHKKIKFFNNYPVFDRRDIVAQVNLTQYAEGMSGKRIDHAWADWVYGQRSNQSQTAIKNWRSTQKLTWHHHQNGNFMFLIPTVLHGRIPHTGGVAHSK
ncbi:MAG: hypothetical protein JWM28_1435, partial [Chitinophagaceae bacterium]|nr:hypothetical protein [Chitinophagaceae bacterium]